MGCSITYWLEILGAALNATFSRLGEPVWLFIGLGVACAAAYFTMKKLQGTAAAKIEARYVVLSGLIGAATMFVISFLWEMFNQPAVRDFGQKEQIAELEKTLQPPPDSPDIVAAKNDISLFAVNALYPACDELNQLIESVAKDVQASNQETFPEPIVGLIWSGLTARTNYYRNFYITENDQPFADTYYMRVTTLSEIQQTLTERLVAYRGGLHSLSELLEEPMIANAISTNTKRQFNTWQAANSLAMQELDSLHNNMTLQMRTVDSQLVLRGLSWPDYMFEHSDD